jgi:hypothetical protein
MALLRKHFDRKTTSMGTDQAETAFKRGFYKALNGKIAEELADMSDDELATWQAGWKPETANYILAEKEWQRRMLAHEFGLNQRLAEYAAKWQRFSAYIGVIGTIAGAVLGAVGSLYLQAPAKSTATESAPAANVTPLFQKK